MLSHSLSAVFRLCPAQTGTGNIQGTVKDATNAVVPSAKVTIVHTATGGQRNTLTNEVGFYLFPAIQVGDYQISVESPGMEAWRGALVLVAGQSAVVDPVIKPGATATEVTVAGDVTPLLTSTSATVSTVVEHARIEQLPLNGRNISTLFYMTVPGFESGRCPAITACATQPRCFRTAPFSKSRVAVAPRAAPWVGYDRRIPCRDAQFIGEDEPARTFILTTRSGTNDLHGSVFETARNSAIGVARARTEFFNKPPHLARNEFGASLGGPVYIPKAYNGRNKTFFFFSYEGYQLRQSTTRNTSVPTAAMREGDFSGLVDFQGREIHPVRSSEHSRRRRQLGAHSFREQPDSPWAAKPIWPNICTASLRCRPQPTIRLSPRTSSARVSSRPGSIR